MLYFSMAFAEAKTNSDQLRPPRFMQSRSPRARSWKRRKFSSMMKNVLTPSAASASHIARYMSSPRGRNVTTWPLPPKNDDVVQKLQPIGQPTDGMIVAAGLPAPLLRGSPITRKSKDDFRGGWVTGASGEAPRYSRNQRIPSPLTISSASILDSRPGMAATWPPTTTDERGECVRTSRHISRTLPTLTMMPEMPTTS